jgi:hypothetical protein
VQARWLAVPVEGLPEALGDPGQRGAGGHM